MKKEIAKMLEKGFMLICVVTAFCMIAMLMAATYYLIRDKSLAESVLKCLAIVLGGYYTYKAINAWWDRLR